jgi:hypothetical protein
MSHLFHGRFWERTKFLLFSELWIWSNMLDSNMLAHPSTPYRQGQHALPTVASFHLPLNHQIILENI